MIPLDLIITFVIASSLLGLAPGPDNIFVLSQSALYGRKSGLFVTLGLCTGLVVHTSAVALGVAAIIKTSAVAFTMLKIVGALYLLYLAWQAFSASATALDRTPPKRRTNQQLYRRGIIMNITNPKISIFFLAFLPQFVSASNGAIAPQIFMLGALFIAVTLVIFGTIALLGGTLGQWFSESEKAQLWLNRVAGFLFTGLAIKLFLAESNTS